MHKIKPQKEDMQLDIQRIFENVRRDSSLLSTLNIEDLLAKVGGIREEKSDYLEGKTLTDILEEKITVLEGLEIYGEEQQKILEKLTDYRYIKNIYELHKGKHIRWITPKKRPIVLERGALLSEIKFTDMGTNLQCLRYDQRTYQIRMDDRIIFQKMSTEELLLLTIYENIKNGKIGHGASKASPQARTEGPSVQRHHP